MEPEDPVQRAEALAVLLAEERRLRAVAESALCDATFLADAGHGLASSLDDYAGLFSEVARLAVPYLADWCLVRLVRDGTAATVALAHADPEKEALLAPFDLGTLDVPAPHGEPLVPGGESALVSGGDACAESF